MSRETFTKSPAPTKRRGRKPTEGLDPKALGTRIRKAREAAGLTLEELAEQIDISHVSLVKIETSQSNPDDRRTRRTIARIAETLNTDFGEDWLRQQLPRAPQLKDIPGLRVAHFDQPFEIDVRGKVAAGTPREPVEFVETITFPPRKLLTDMPTLALFVDGDSMRDEGIWPGDIVFIAACPEPLNGQTIVARVDGETTLKKFYRRGNKVILKPANNEHAEIWKTLGLNQVECIGEYIGLLRMKK